jgi:hypothetical protein
VKSGRGKSKSKPKSGKAAKKKSKGKSKKQSKSANKKNSKSADKKKKTKSANKKKKSKSANKKKKTKSAHKNKNTKSANKKKKTKSTHKKNKSKSGHQKQKSLETSRQSASSCDWTTVVTAIKKYILYTNNLNQNKRIKSFVALGQQKAGKGATSFASTYNILSDATQQGGSCNGVAANSSVTALYTKLQNCSASAPSICNISLSDADNATVTSCYPALLNYTTAFQVSIDPKMCLNIQLCCSTARGPI